MPSMKREEILAFLRRHRNDLHRRFGVQRIGLFGSYARNEATEYSDIDFVVEMNEKTYRKRWELTRFLESKLHKPIDLGYLDSLHPFIRKRIENEVIFV